ncbi:MAG: hypothetical protein HY996_02880 [Micrococcales bacterium]|nr:hypothetical protein [Micrococcales bacterium]
MSATPSTERAPSSFSSIARRPRWIGALILALAVAAGFAALGQWQIGRAVENAVTSGPDTERAIPLDRLDRPQTGVSNAEAGRVATVTGRFIAGDAALVSDRYRIGVRDGLGGATGWWTVGRLRTSDGASLVVALGWAPTRADAAAAARELPTGEMRLRGRYTVSETPDTDDPEQGKRTVVSVAALLNQWPDPGAYYGGYLISDRGLAGLERIVAPPPSQETQLGLLNLFYALEWAIFAGFALYLWYRLVKDELEKEAETTSEPVLASAGS